MYVRNDDAVLQPAEPDYRVVNLPTTLRLPRYKSNFELTHRFNGNLRRGDFGDQTSTLFGLDEGAVIGFEYRFAPIRHVELAVYRTAIEAGSENVNARPRAEDLSATCRSMARYDVEPDAELWARIEGIENGLTDPW